MTVIVTIFIPQVYQIKVMYCCTLSSLIFFIQVCNIMRKRHQNE